MVKLPVIGITIGDPSGIGPEVVVKALSKISKQVPDFIPLVIGDRWIIEETIALLKLPLKVRTVIEDIDVLEESNNTLLVYSPNLLKRENFKYGQISANCGKAVVSYLESTVKLVNSGKIDAIVSGPVNKAAIQAAGYQLIDQAQFYTEATGANKEEIATMVSAGRFRAFMVTKHIPLSKVASSLTVKRVAWVIQTAWTTLQYLGIKSPRLGVAALNPHVGEKGILGEEEITIIKPGMEEALARGFSSIGPMSGKSAFEKMGRGELDGVIAMYHDQTAPVSLLGGPSTTMTLGIPVLRASVGHGTAFDIAGKGIADPSACIEAISLVKKIVLGKINSEKR